MTIRDDRFWATFLGVEPTAWARQGGSVEPHAGLLGYRGFWCFRRNRRTVISAPEAWVPHLARIVARHSGVDLMEAAFWEHALPRDFDRAVGPAFQGSLEPARFKRILNPFVRPVRHTDVTAAESFRTACGAEWNLPDEATQWPHAYFDEGSISAWAAYRDWSDEAGDPCVITRPDARSRGRGAAVTSAVVAAALASGKLLLYQTLESNEPSVRIAFALGYERYANHLAVRLKHDSP
jgi:hypothetical protein